MRSSNAELTIYRNENFTIDRTLVNKDGSPFLISKGLPNPYLLITINSSKYKQNNQNKINYFLPLIDFPRFNFTNVVPITDLKNVDGEELYPDGFPNGLTLTNVGGTLVCMSAYYNGDLVGIEPDDAVFSFTEDGITLYKYWKPNSNVEGSGGEWVDYKFRFAKLFSSQDTASFVEQTYYYGIQLVSGWSKYDVLLEMCISNNIYVTDNDTEATLLDKLILSDIEIPDSVLSDAPIAKYLYVLPILGPTKLSVLSNLEGRML